jgi:hypothetical protein
LVIDIPSKSLITQIYNYFKKCNDVTPANLLAILRRSVTTFEGKLDCKSDIGKILGYIRDGFCYCPHARSGRLTPPVGTPKGSGLGDRPEVRTPQGSGARFRRFIERPSDGSGTPLPSPWDIRQAWLTRRGLRRKVRMRGFPQFSGSHLARGYS